MKSVLVLIVVIAVGVVGLGFYRGWFAFSSQGTDHESNVTFTLDKEKISDDKDMAKEKMQGQKVSEETGDRSEKAEKTKTTVRQPC